MPKSYAEAMKDREMQRWKEEIKKWDGLSKDQKYSSYVAGMKSY